MVTDAAFTPLKSLRQLKAGDTIRSRVSGNAYLVTAVYGEWAVALDTIRISDPAEWLVLRRHRVHRRGWRRDRAEAGGGDA